MKNVWKIIGVSAAVAFAPGAPLSAQDGRIEGTVVVGQVPVDDADVTLTGQGRRVRVDGSGRFALEDVPPGIYAIEAESPRWGRAVESVRVIAGQTTRVVLSLEAVFHLDEMVVSAGAGASRRTEAYQPASVVTSRELVALGEATLGETLSREPGVSSTYFGPGASRPIIRGIGGDRVRVLEGGVGVGDASSTSPDHAVGLETRTAERIEVIRGPATLLYGSSAVGGVVNVLDGKIAREPPTQTVSGFVEGLGGSVADERTGAAAITATAGPVVFHGSGLWRDASDYSIPGFAEAGGPDEPGEEPGTLENSALESRRGSLGLTYVSEGGFLGVAWTEQRSDYGIPGHGHEGEEPEEAEGEEEGAVTIDLNQSRFDLEGALRFRGVIRNVKARVGVSDYRHVELEGDEIGTVFTNDFVEGRVESEHELSSRLRGALGAQYATRDFRADGDEAFVPPSETGTVAVFAYEEFEVSEPFRLEGGLRFERQSAQQPAARSLDRTDNAVSFSGGMSWDATEHFSVSGSASRSIKFPNAEELFSNGPHAATRAFEIGDPSLNKEVALGVDITGHVHGDRFRGSASVFTTGFRDYIYEVGTGEVRDGLDVFEFVQGDARFSGFEVEASVDVVESDAGANGPHLSLEVMGDYVSARLTDLDESLPRIPPMRFSVGTNYRQGPLVMQGTVRRTTQQDDVGPLESPTPGFTMIDASASYRFFTGSLFHDITLVANNLSNSEARLHTSFLKDLAPLPGREIRLVYRINF